MVKTRRALVAGALLVVALGAAVAPALAGPTSDPKTAAGYGGGWLARLINEQGFVPANSQPNPPPNYAGTVDAALALAAAGVGNDAFVKATNFMAANVDAYAVSGGSDDAGRLGNLIMLAVAASRDPRAFGGSDLVARLLATRRTSGSDAGLFGAQDPSFVGVFRQSLAIMGLKAANQTVPADAVTWLTNQQCANAGWPGYRADTSTACAADEADTNDTALATEALAAIAASPSKGDGLAYLDGAQNADGGFGFSPGGATDANSTGVAIQAIVARGESPTTGRWASASANPYSALLGLQLGCEAAEADRGAFAYQPESNGSLKANAFATVQAVPAAAGRAYPLAPATLSEAEPTVPCATAATTTTTAAPATTATTVRPTVNTVAVAGAGLPRTGVPTGAALALGLGLLGFGLLIVAGSTRDPQDFEARP